MILTPEIFMRSYCVATDAIYDPTYTYGRNYCMYVTCLLKDTCARRFKTWIGYIENVMIISNVTYTLRNFPLFYGVYDRQLGCQYFHRKINGAPVNHLQDSARKFNGTFP